MKEGPLDKLSSTYVKYYSLTEHLPVNGITVLFNGGVPFKQYIPKKHKQYGIKIYKLCNSKGYTYDMRVYLGKERTHATDTVTPTHATVAELKRRIQNVGHKLYMNNFLSSLDLFDNLHTKAINCCGTVRLNRKGMPQDFRNTLRLEWGDIKTRVTGNLTAMI
jgi:hypothetical protein